MPLMKGKSEKAFKQNIRTEYKEGKPLKQSLAIAYAMKRKAKKMADGGMAKSSPSPSPSPAPAIDPDKAKLFQSSMRAGGHLSKGGEVKGVHKSSMDVARPANAKEKRYAGESEAGENLRSSDIRADALGKAKDEHNKILGELKSMPNPKLKGMAEGGMVKPACTNCGYQSSGMGHTDPDLSYHENDSGFMSHEGDVKRPNSMAMSENGRKLNQHGEHEEGEQGGGQGFHSESYMGKVNDPHDEYQAKNPGEDLVGRIMKQKQMSYSEGGKVANSDHGVNDEDLAGFSPNEFDDLTLRDDLESSYGDDDNSGDDLGNEQEDEDRKDIVARIMASRKKKDKLPRPA